MNINFSAPATSSQTSFTQGQYVGVDLNFGAATGTVLVIKAPDIVVATLSATGVTGYTVTDPTASYFLQCTAVSGGVIVASLYRAAGPGGERRLVPNTVDFCWDFNVHGGGPGDIPLVPSRPLAPGTLALTVGRRTLLPVDGAGGCTLVLNQGSNNVWFPEDLVALNGGPALGFSNTALPDISSGMVAHIVNGLTMGRVIWTVGVLEPATN